MKSTLTRTARRHAKALEITDREIVVELVDGTRHHATLTLFPILAEATPQERAHWQFIAARSSIYWPDIDEHISVFSIVHPEQTIGVNSEAAARHIKQNQERRSGSA